MSLPFNITLSIDTLGRRSCYVGLINDADEN